MQLLADCKFARGENLKLKNHPTKKLINFENSFAGGAKKERGNFWYKRADSSTAIHCYRRSIEFLDAQETEMQILNDENIDVSKLTDSEKVELQLTKDKIKKLIELRAAAYNNLAAAQMKTEAFDQALKSIDNVLQLDADNVKALFRKAKILRETGETEAAILVLKKALKLDASSRVIAQELRYLESKRLEERRKEKNMYQRMFETTPEKEREKRERVAKKAAYKKWALGVGMAVAAASAVAYQMLAV